MKIDMREYEVVTSYFARKKHLEEAGFLVVSIAQSQPPGIEVLEVPALAPSDFCRKLSGQKKHAQSAREYIRAHSSAETVGRIEEQIKVLPSTKIAFVCWEGKDENCHRKSARAVLNKNFTFMDKVEEF